MMNKKKIPRNMNNKEEALFWDTHDFIDYIDDTYEEDITLSKELKNKIFAHYKERSKKTTYNEFMFNSLSSSNLVSIGQYIYMETCSSVDDNPKVKDEEINDYNYQEL